MKTLLVELKEKVQPYFNTNKNIEFHSVVSIDLLLPFENQLFEIGQSKSEKIAEECRQDGYQLPCKFAQKWYCQIEDGRWRKHKCKQNHFPLSQSGSAKIFKKCACFTPEGLVYKKIPVRK